jgi:hypothetical protein
MSPTIIQRIAQAQDIRHGCMSDNGKWRPKEMMPHLYSMPSPNTESDLADPSWRWNPRAGLYFGCTLPQSAKWFSPVEVEESQRYGFTVYTLMVCGRRWIGDTQALFDIRAVKEVTG